MGDGGNELDPRFLSLCTVFSLPGPADDTIRNIFGSILSGHTTSFTDDVKSSVHGVVDATVRLYRVRTCSRNARVSIVTYAKFFSWRSTSSAGRRKSSCTRSICVMSVASSTG